jgi:hypothetical protein
MNRSTVIGSLIVIGMAIAAGTAIKLNVGYASEVAANHKLRIELAAKDSIIAKQSEDIFEQKEVIKNLEETITLREDEISFWGHILNQLATNHPAEANKIARESGIKADF